MSEVIDALLADISSQGAAIKPPRILLGQFERVGSTFLLDEIEKTATVHNEPYKLLVPTAWPISRAHDGELVSVDEFFAGQETSASSAHWLRNFVASLHHPGGQVVKETNLFLALPQFLDVFPHSSVEFLTRNPLGIVSSFKRNDLYNRWGYENVRQLLGRQLELTRPDGYDALKHMATHEGLWHQRVAWLVGLNAVLLSRYVEPERVSKVIDYEQDVIPLSTDETIANDRVQDSIFATNIRKTHDDYEARFTNREISEVSSAMEACAEFVQREFDDQDTRWFDALFARHVGVTRASTARVSTPIGSVSTATEAVGMIPVISTETVVTEDRRLVKLSDEQNIQWDHSLVTNQQLANFLQKLREAGHNPAENFMLLLDNMPTTRGGRIGYNGEVESFMVADGYEQHPAYWVTWLTAALYAYQQGMRLPRYAEWQQVIDCHGIPTNEETSNFNYAHDDAIRTGQATTDLPDDFFGNVKIWCADWSSPTAVNKSLAGISWKQYYHEGYRAKAERPYLTNSRIIGSRLVCCAECSEPQPRSMQEVADKLAEVTAMMEETVRTQDDLTRLNRKISDSLTTQACTHQE